jgi:tyrosyl-tRNA synthetase
MTTIQETYNARELNSCDKKMTTMLYPILQALDEKYTESDVFYGSITQKNMCEYSLNLMKISVRIHILPECMGRCITR